jgi:hypothetical protein
MPNWFGVPTLVPYAISNSNQGVYYSYQWNRRILRGGSLNFKEPSVPVLSMFPESKNRQLQLFQQP